MARKLLIRDLTLRDGQQSSFATRMNQNQVDRVLPFYKDAKFYAMEVWGGAVPDSVMRYLNENPWDRLEKIKAVIGDVSKLTALSRGRNLFGYAPYTDEIIEGFCKNAIESGLGIMRIFDALNDVNNVKSTIKYVKKYGGMADCAVCYTIDPKYPKLSLIDKLKGKKNPEPVFTNEYFLNKAKEMEALGADMITIKDMSGLINPARISEIMQLFKSNLKIPVDFHTHCTPGYGLGAVLSAIVHGVDIVDTNIWNFAGGPAAPAIELIYIFCKKLGIELDVNMEAVAKINKELYTIRKELEAYDAVKQFPNPFNPLTDTLPANIDKLFDDAIAAAKSNNEEALLKACHAIEAYFNFPKPNELVKKAEVPGGMYTNMVAQLKQLNSMEILEDAMKLIPTVRLAAGLPPLVTPTSQIVGAQAVNCALDIKNGKPMYSNVSNQFVALVKGEYGKTPVPVDPEFRLKIAGTREEIPYDTSKYQMQENPVLTEFGGVKLAENEKEVLLMELFPAVAKNFLTKQKEARYMATHKATQAQQSVEVQKEEPITGKVVEAPMPGNIFKILVKPGDVVSKGQNVLVLEAMKMENNITSDYAGKVKRILTQEGKSVTAGAKLIEIEI
ncbi:biotin/lipoyl-containing protein [Butyricimonas virosa]|jgi:pyruvate carboxylase subunit B|uniref:Carboxylase n=2 Tax=Butyricimonas virosa TaxID=544645 RepID=A0A415QKN9_9BACT|nr:biotin/lipoyl-containing protein [Butyricimonas virosa]MBR5461831.1 carboxylase [Butyricimonas sp.]MCI6413934.1 carboxylase [Butyricimonas virosa]MCI7164612.1 carboxylase [Butyricimonas virosa]MDY5011784.1 biotin/lipoyl-containing protein [Butyricimonas virosa]RGV32275.1 carboxylase [Butyricimonas virosa]